jgi:hypothetical protein
MFTIEKGEAGTTLGNKDCVIINKKVLIGMDCVGVSMSKYIDDYQVGETLTVLQAAKILDCIVAGVKYEEHYVSYTKWKQASYMRFETDGQQLEIYKVKGTISGNPEGCVGTVNENYRDSFECKVRKIKGNRTEKHTNKLIRDEHVLYDIKTGGPPKNPYM